MLSVSEMWRAPYQSDTSMPYDFSRIIRAPAIVLSEKESLEKMYFIFLSIIIFFFR